jgi:ferredoxin
MAAFLVDLNESVMPDFFFMDAITSMQGPGPGNGSPYPLHLVLGSVNPLALDIVASKIIGYNPLEIETNAEGIGRKRWLTSVDEVAVEGADIVHHIRSDYQLTRRVSLVKMSAGIVWRRFLHICKRERKPVFYLERCVGCGACIEICPVQALNSSPHNPKKIKVSNRKCIHCFCCHEICQNNAIEIR